MGVDTGDGSHGLTARAVGSVKGNPRPNPHPLKPAYTPPHLLLTKGLSGTAWQGRRATVAPLGLGS